MCIQSVHVYTVEIGILVCKRPVELLGHDTTFKFAKSIWDKLDAKAVTKYKKIVSELETKLSDTVATSDDDIEMKSDTESNDTESNNNDTEYNDENDIELESLITGCSESLTKSKVARKHVS